MHAFWYAFSIFIKKNKKITEKIIFYIDFSANKHKYTNGFNHNYN